MQFIHELRYRTIYRDLIIGLTSGIMLVISLLGALYYVYYSREMVNQLSQRAENITDQMTSVLVPLLWSISENEIQQLTKAYLQSGTLAGAKILSDAYVIVNETPKNIENFFIIERPVFMQVSPSQKKKIGFVQLYFSQDYINDTQNAMIHTILSICCAVIICIVIGMHILLKLFLERPIQHCIQGIRTIADGYYKTSLQNVNHQDINIIIKEVNHMAFQIEQRTNQLDKEICERKKAEQELKQLYVALSESELKYRGIFENAMEGIFQAVPFGKIINANPRMAKIFGYDTTVDLINSINNFIENLFIDTQQKELLTTLIFQKNEINAFEAECYRRDGKNIWVSLYGRIVKNDEGEIDHIEGLLEDISERKNAQDQLEEANKILEKRVEERTKALKRSNEALENAREQALSAAKAKGDFLANMSHEIRTPMNGIIGATQLLMNEKLEPKVGHFVKIIHSSAHSLLGIINDILDFTKIEAGKMQLESQPFLVEEVLNRATSIFTSKSVEKHLEILINIPPNSPRALIGDPLRLQQIFTNLIGNAIKFTKNAGLIIVGIKDFQYMDDIVIITFYVKDTGIGIPPEKVKTLFAPFTQCDASTSRKYGGTGLGLSICKQLTSLMKGKIWVESEINKGSTFFFSVHMKRQDEDFDLSKQIPSEMKDMNILVVDDSFDTRMIIKSMLKPYDFQVTLANSGKDAITKINSFKGTDQEIKMVVIDWMMPDMDGIETVVFMREKLKLDIPIILMTAFESQIQQKDIELTKINAFITKPIFQSMLIKLILDTYFKKTITSQSLVIQRDDTECKNFMKSRRVLVAEDNLVNQDIILTMLEDNGVSVKIAQNGLEAVASVEKEFFDLILMDIQMPELDGYEATQQIRKNPKNDSIPIIAMTAHAMKGDKEKCLSVGMDNYVSKPINQELLFQTMIESLNAKRGISNPETSKPETSEISKPEISEISKLEISNPEISKLEISESEISKLEISKPEISKLEISEPEISKLEISKPEISKPVTSNTCEKNIVQNYTLPDAVAGIEIKNALKLLKIKPSSYIRILNKFLVNSQGVLSDIKTEFEQGNFQNISQIFHSVKGSAGNLGAYKLYNIAKDLEIITKSNKLVSLDQPTMEQFKEALAEVTKSIQTMNIDMK